MCRHGSFWTLMRSDGVLYNIWMDRWCPPKRKKNKKRLKQKRQIKDLYNNKYQILKDICHNYFKNSKYNSTTISCGCNKKFAFCGVEILLFLWYNDYKGGIFMPELAFIVVTEGSQTVMTPDGPNPQLMSPLIALRPPVLPTAFSFALSVGVRNVDLTKNNLFQLRICAPNGEEIYAPEPFNLGSESKLPARLPEEYRGFVLVVDLRNVMFNTDGCYIIEIYINDVLIGTTKLPVFLKDE